MVDEDVVDQHLGVVLNDVLNALYQAKQASWAASRSPHGDDLRTLVAYLIDRSGVLMEAEERLGGRAPGIASPSSHQRGNLVSEAGGDLDAAVAMLVERLDALAHGVRGSAVSIAGSAEATLLEELADGIEVRIERLRPR